ncbi:hypothetical protein NCS56_00515500 [Fusarium sp. Ph1]|nr:hypothetical protein NCS56_00515500 [Fusarium sp. Ph1]
MATEGLLKPVPGVKPMAGGYYLWRYLPNLGAAILFLLLFLASSLFIAWKIWRTRTKFCTLFAVGCFFEVVGYGVRAGANSNTDKMMRYLIQSMFIVTAPVLFAASIYMVLARIITSIRADKYSLIRPAKVEALAWL